MLIISVRNNENITGKRKAKTEQKKEKQNKAKQTKTEKNKGVQKL